MVYEIKEFKVNDSITLKLENNKTNIYIKGELFQQCKYLLLNIPLEEANNINSVDDIAENLDDSLHGRDGVVFDISPDVEFWAHSSNLQVWCEHSYDTRLLHSNLAFALLKKLAEIGDVIARKKLKEEISKRYVFGNFKIKDFLSEEGFLDILSKEELLSLVDEGDILLKLEQLVGQTLRINTIKFPDPKGFVINKGLITWLSLDNCGLKKIPEIIKELKSLEGLIFKRNSLKTLPQWIGNSTQLKYLDVSNNQLEDLPDSIGDLKNLKKLVLSNNKLKRLPESIGNLRKLESLFIQHNKIKNLPESVGKLQTLKRLWISANFLKSLPASIGKLKMLRELNISDNQLDTLPKSIGLLSSLKFLIMGENPIRELPSSINLLESLETLSMGGIDESVWNLSDYMKKKVRIYKKKFESALL
ncbi:hypothetical protein LCGC14_0968770 [marine sediment metagenome]|uniref:Disease resistance R13L4/SHOC-2-like LRR domain-containing protein n=1 Tax=marine sediment metagenome TaxID=412755 RepID=A0A0F9NGS6_9ZZZZ